MWAGRASTCHKRENEKLSNSAAEGRLDLGIAPKHPRGLCGSQSSAGGHLREKLEAAIWFSGLKMAEGTKYDEGC